MACRPLQRSDVPPRSVMRPRLCAVVCGLAILGAGGAAGAATPVPDFKGERASLARQMARIAGVRVRAGVFYIAPENWRDDIRPGVVYLQTPQPEALVPDGSPVCVWTFRKAAADQKLVEMPDLKGLSRKDALTKTRDLGLPVLESVDDGADELVVLDQYPRAKEQVYARTAAYITLGARETENAAEKPAEKAVDPP